MKIRPTSDAALTSVASRPGRKTAIVAVLFGVAVALIAFRAQIGAFFGAM